MNKNYLTSLSNDNFKTNIRTVVDVVNSMNIPNSTIAARAAIQLMTPRIKATEELMRPITEVTTDLRKNQSISFLRLIESHQLIFQKLNSPFAHLNTSGGFYNPALISLNSAFYNELTKEGYLTDEGKEDWYDLTTEELPDNAEEEEPGNKVEKLTQTLNSKVKEMDKGFFHGLITPFSTREEFGRYVSQEIISLLLSIIMTYAMTIGVAQAERAAQILWISIHNRLKH